MGLFDSFLKELAIRRRRRALKSCVVRVAEAVRDANYALARLDMVAERRAQATIARENALYEKLFAELIKLESPDDVVRRSAQA